MFAIYKKELKSYFTSMVGCVFLSILLIIISIYFFVVNMLNMVADFSMALNAITFVVVLLIPIITMRIIAEENRQKTDQLLLTSPISVTKIVVGKYLALLTLYGIAMVVLCAYPLIMTLYGPAQLAQSYSSIFGFFLMGGSYIAIGLFISSLTESQVIAAVISFIVMIFTYLMSSLAQLLPSDHISVWVIMAGVMIALVVVAHMMLRNYIISGVLLVVTQTALALIYFFKPSLYDGLIVNIMDWFSVVARFSSFSLGIMDISALVYYLSVIFVFIFFTILKIKKKRWS